MHDDTLLEARRIFHLHADLFRTERSCLADLLLSVGDFEHRGLHRALGHAGIFDYLHRWPPVAVQFPGAPRGARGERGHQKSEDGGSERAGTTGLG